MVVGGRPYPRRRAFRRSTVRDATIQLDDRRRARDRRAAPDHRSQLGAARGGPQQGLAAGRRKERLRLGRDARATADRRRRQLAHDRGRGSSLGGADAGARRRRMAARTSVRRSPCKRAWRKAADGNFMGLRGIVSASGGEFSLNGIDEVNVQRRGAQFRARRDRRPHAHSERRDPHAHRPHALRGRRRPRRAGPRDAARRASSTARCRRRSATRSSCALTGGGGVARIDFAERGIEVEQFSLTTPEGSASVIGQASLGGETPGLSFALSLTQDAGGGRARSLAALRRGEDARSGSTSTSSAGTLGPATLQVALPPDHIGPRARGKVLPSYCARRRPCRSRTATFSPIRTFPLIKNAVGGITFGNATASIWAQTGVVEVPGSGDLQAGGTTLIIPELGRTRAARRPASGARRFGRGARRGLEHAAALDRRQAGHRAGERFRAKRRFRSTRTSRSTRATSPT